MSPEAGAEAFQFSTAREILTPREVRDVEKMCGLGYFGELNQYNSKSRKTWRPSCPCGTAEVRLCCSYWLELRVHVRMCKLHKKFTHNS